MTHQYMATVSWAGVGETFPGKRYSPGHRWTFGGGGAVPVAAADCVVPLPLSRADAVDPEEAFVAAVSSCHMLVFLSIAAKKRFVVDAYEDRAVGIMTKNPDGKLFISKITLDPAIAFSGDKRPTPEQIADMHHLAHQEWFI